MKSSDHSLRDVPQTLFVGARLLGVGAPAHERTLLADGGRIRAFGAAARRAAGRSARRVDLAGAILAPGYVDIHTHGAVGVDFVTSDAGGLERAARHYHAHGVTGALLSLYPTPIEDLVRCVERLAAHVAAGVGGGLYLGLHLEGPYLNPRRPGALPGGVFRTYDRREVARLLKAGGGWIKTMTVAPELPGGHALVRHLQRAGVVPFFGHSDAGYEETRRAVALGVRHATHLFNAMRGLHHRDPGAVTALLEDPEVAVELIADGHHIDPAVLRLVHAVKPRRKVILVSDSVAPCGQRPGPCSFAGTPAIARGGRITLEDGTLAGSLLTLERAVRLQRSLGLSPRDACLLASESPARALGAFPERGSMERGARADLVALDGELRVLGTWSAGVEVYRKRR